MATKTNVAPILGKILIFGTIPIQLISFVLFSNDVKLHAIGGIIAGMGFLLGLKLLWSQMGGKFYKLGSVVMGLTLLATYTAMLALHR